MKRIVFFAFVAMLVMPLAPAASATTAPTDRDAMAQATGSLTAPWACSNALGTPNISTLASLL